MGKNLARYQVNFEKVFVSGLLKGRRYPCAFIRFADWQSADQFRQKCDGKTVVESCANTGAYIRECPILSAIEPAPMYARERD